MEIRQMQYFLCLAEEKNVTRAARQLNIVQPALSMQIAKLETEFGQKLFDRGPNGMVTTAAGDALARLITPVLRDVEYAKQEMARLKGKISGTIRAGLIASAAQSVMARSSAAVTNKYPDIIFSACEGYTETLIEWVRTGQLDFAIVNIPRGRTSLATHRILDEEMVLAYRKDATLDVPTNLDFSHLADFDLVLPSKRHGLRTILDEQASASGVRLSPRLELDTLPALCEVIASTNLVTILPTIALQQWLADGRVRARRFVNPRLSRTIAWVHHPRRPISTAANAVLEILVADLVKAASFAGRNIRPIPANDRRSRDKTSRRTISR